MTWASAYIGRPWTDERCCGYYFAVIQQEVFGRSVDGEKIASVIGALSAARIMAAIFASSDAAAEFGYRATADPMDGDAVFLSQRTRPHHIGTVALIGGKFHVLHTLEGIGTILSDRLDLRANGWRTAGFWTWADSTSK